MCMGLSAIGCTVLVSWGVWQHFMDQDPTVDIWKVRIMLPQPFCQTAEYTKVHVSSQLHPLQGVCKRAEEYVICRQDWSEISVQQSTMVA